MKKQATSKEKERMGKVAALGCVICAMPAHIHHTGTHLGGGRNHADIVPLCARHHTTGGYGEAIHAGKKAFEAKYKTEDQMLKWVKVMLGEMF